MPLSRPDTYPRVLNLVWDANPKSILDIGCGWGGMGVMFRQICDIRWGRMKLWETIIHGIEAYTGYQNPIWTTIYNHVYIGDAVDTIEKTETSYDIIYLGDIVEHLEAERAKLLVERAVKRANKYVVITTPASFSDNEGEAKRFGNPLETHKILVDETIYPPDAIVEQYGNQKIIIISK